MTSRKNASENNGSMPPLQLLMIEIVPVGATVVEHALRCLRFHSVSQRLPCQFVNTPGQDTVAIRAYRTSTNDEPYIQKADFVKLRDLSFTYSVPPRFIAFTGGQDASIVLAGHDLKLWSDYAGPDPETNSYGGRLFARADVYTLPMIQRWTLALNFSF